MWRGNNIPDPGLLLIGALDSQRTPFNGARRPLGHTGIVRAALRGRSSCGAGPHHNQPHPILWPLRWVGIGGRPPGPTLSSFIHHAIKLSSCCCFFLFMLLGGVGDVLILASYQESPCDFSSATRPWGADPVLIGTQRACLDYDYTCKYTCFTFLTAFYHINIQHLDCFHFATCRLWFY